MPQIVRLRCGGMWLHDLQVLCETNVREGSVIYVAVPQERRSRDQLTISVHDAKDGDCAALYVCTSDSVVDLMKMLQDVLGVPADAQTLIFGGRTLTADDTVSGCGIMDGSTVHMAVGKRRTAEMQMSPGGTWRHAP